MPEKAQDNEKNQGTIIVKKLDNIDVRLDRFEERQNRFEERQDRFEERQDRFEERQDRFEERFDKIEQTLGTHSQLLQEHSDVLKKHSKQFDSLTNLTMKLYNIIDDERQKNEKFREQVLTIVDNIAKKYDLFKTEKMAIGANVDRLQHDIDGLTESDTKQNHAISKLESRVDRLEANRPAA